MTRKINKSTVSFDISQNITHITSRSYDGSIEQKKQLWFDDDDFIRMKRKTALAVRRFRLGYPDCYKICIRGLEHVLKPESLEQRKIHKDILISSVLQEQRRQRIVGINCPNDIAIVSQFHSRWSSEIARDLARDTVGSDSPRKYMNKKKSLVLEDHLTYKMDNGMSTENNIVGISTEAINV